MKDELETAWSWTSFPHFHCQSVVNRVLMNRTYYTYVNAPIRSIGIEEFSDFVFLCMIQLK